MDNPFARLAQQQQQQWQQPPTQALQGQRLSGQSSGVFSSRHQQPGVNQTAQLQQVTGSGGAVRGDSIDTGVPGSAASGLPCQRMRNGQQLEHQQQQQAGSGGGGGGGVKEPVPLCVGGWAGVAAVTPSRVSGAMSGKCHGCHEWHECHGWHECHAWQCVVLVTVSERGGRDSDVLLGHVVAGKCNFGVFPGHSVLHQATEQNSDRSRYSAVSTVWPAVQHVPLNVHPCAFA
eukprot:scaffold216657_cov24-Tisochrysis_lutea.AAC.1